MMIKREKGVRDVHLERTLTIETNEEVPERFEEAEDARARVLLLRVAQDGVALDDVGEGVGVELDVVRCPESLDESELSATDDDGAGEDARDGDEAVLGGVDRVEEDFGGLYRGIEREGSVSLLKSRS